ncbi:MAG: hypothetical protein AVDCRST_MAG48-522, partial [uncultured Friedmanniella sp.]
GDEPEGGGPRRAARPARRRALALRPAAHPRPAGGRGRRPGGPAARLEGPAAGGAGRARRAGLALHRDTQPRHRPLAQRRLPARAAHRGAARPPGRGRHQPGARPVAGGRGPGLADARAPGGDRRRLLRGLFGGRHRRPAADPGRHRQVPAALRPAQPPARPAGEGGHPLM